MNVLYLVAQSCLSLWDPLDYSPPGFSVHGILQARILDRVAMPSPRRSSQPKGQTQVSCTVGGFFTSWATQEAQIIDYCTENEKQNCCLSTKECLSVLGVHPHDHMADWQLRLPATA